MAEYGIGEGEIIVPDNPYYAVVNVRIEPSSHSQGTGDEEDEEKDKKKEEDKPNTSGSFKDQDVIELSSADNNYILEFSTTVNSAQGKDQLETEINISIVDRTGALIDSILGQLYSDTVIKYSYGYANGVMSEEMEANLSRYGSTITPQGERIDIVLVTTPVDDQENDGKDTGTYSGTPSDIVKQIAEEEGWKLGDIEPTKPLTKTTTTVVASEDQKKQQDEFMKDYNDRMTDPKRWFEEQQKKREEDKKKNEFDVNDLLDPSNVLKKNK